MRVPHQGWSDLVLLPGLLALWLAGGACRSEPAPGGTDAGCTYESCSPVCRARDAWFRGCPDGACLCSDQLDGGREESWRDTTGDGRDDAALPPCDGYRVPIEERPGASPGVVCRRLSMDELEESLLEFAGDGDYIAFRATPDTSPLRLWLYHRPSRCITLLDGLTDLAPAHRGVGATDPSVEQQRIAYVAGGTERETGIERWQIRLIRVGDSTPVILRELAEVPLDRTHGKVPFMDSLVLRYPWIAYRKSGSENRWRWLAYAYNIETGEERNLSDAPEGMPADPDGYWGSVIRVDLLDSTAVFGAQWGGAGSPLFEEIIQVDVETGEAAILTSDPAGQYWATITPRWVAWLDQRIAPRCRWMSLCRTDVYGFERETGTEHALVTAPPSMQGPWMDGEGDWLLYEDQRDGTDVTTSSDREEDMYAFHLPTKTEVRVTDWPGFEMYPKVYDRHDGTFGALFVQEISYGRALYRLWDCDLPAPATEHGGR
jgi:hypothetical protein